MLYEYLNGISKFYFFLARTLTHAENHIETVSVFVAWAYQTGCLWRGVKVLLNKKMFFFPEKIFLAYTTFLFNREKLISVGHFAPQIENFS